MPLLVGSSMKGRGGDQEIEKIREELRPDEEVLFIATQAKAIQPSTVFITTERVIYRKPGIGSSLLESVQWDDISDYVMDKGVMKSSIKIMKSGGGNDFLITSLKKKDAIRIREIVDERVIAARKAKRQPTQVVQQAQSPLDQLKTKFVNGEITQEEYEARKKVLEE